MFARSKMSAPSFTMPMSAVMAKLASSVADIFVAWQNRRAVAGLAGADDALLRDLGLTRQDVQSALAQPLFRDPSADLSDRIAERRFATRKNLRNQIAATPFHSTDTLLVKTPDLAA